MYLKEYEIVEISISDKSKSKWEKKINQKIENNVIKIHWSLLKGSTFRTIFINVKCDDCNKIHERRIRDLDINKNIHYCNSCVNTGKRNGMYGKPCSEYNKECTRRWMIENGNPFTWENSKGIIKEKKPWLKAHEFNRGKKRSDYTKKKMSNSALLAFKEGRRTSTSGWAIKHTKEYKNIKYQSKYELYFLQYIEKLNKLDKIEPGPKIQYIDIDGKEHTYFVDFKIKNTNIVFEIKSDYYWNKKLETNIIKMKTTSKYFNYNLIMDNNFDNIKELFNE